MKTLLLLLLLCLPMQAATRTVKATYYAAKFAHRHTANGERYNPTALTAAHRTLPFGTCVALTNTKNNKTVNVRINDRGPWLKGRSFDVSKAAANELGMVPKGIANVRYEVVGRENCEAEY